MIFQRLGRFLEEEIKKIQRLSEELYKQKPKEMIRSPLYEPDLNEKNYAYNIVSI